MYLSKNASRARIREAENARRNRAEILTAFNSGQATRRELIKWGALTAAGALAFKNGLNPFARSAFASVPTGTPLSPLFGVQKFSQPLQRLDVQHPIPLTKNFLNEAAFPFGSGLPNAKRFSYHNDFNAFPGPVQFNPFRNPVTNRGPMEGRPPGHFFAHQRWEEFFPKKAYVLSWAAPHRVKLHPGFPVQEPNKVWAYGSGRFARGSLPPPLIKLRYGEPTILRLYNNTPVDRAQNGGFGRNETQLHFHNAHNAAESDGATAAHHYPGTFYDYLWGTALARRDRINKFATDPRAAGPDDGFGINKVPGDFRELQGSLWFHDHRFYFTAQNLYKGAFGAVNLYSGIDRGHERLDTGGNLRLPSGFLLNWGNVDFDVNLILSDAATDQEGQLFYDLFANVNGAFPGGNGFLGDLPLVNFSYAPYFEVLPRKYRFRLNNVCSSRFLKLVLADEQGNPVPFQFIANDGNLVAHPITLTELDEQGTAERYDIVVDFSGFPRGSKIKLVNVLRAQGAIIEGAGTNGVVPLADALAGTGNAALDPGVGPFLEFRVVDQVQSVDVPGVTLNRFNAAGSNDRSRVPTTLTEEIPIVEPVRSRLIEFHGLGQGVPELIPDGPDDVPEGFNFAWRILIDDGAEHRFNANRISLLVPKPGEVEHWTLVGGPVWDHPIHVHFEEGVTIGRGSNAPVGSATGLNFDLPISDTERNVRKDVWRLRQTGGRPFVTFQVQFGEFGGSYVTHCHNTVHEDFAMLLRLQILAGGNATHSVITPTPIATPDGVHFLTPDILPEGDPNSTLPPSSESDNVTGT